MRHRAVSTVATIISRGRGQHETDRSLLVGSGPAADTAHGPGRTAVRRGGYRGRVYRAVRSADAGAGGPRRCRCSTRCGRAKAPRRATAASPAATCVRATTSWPRSSARTRAKAIQTEAKVAREDLADFIARENIDCDFKMTGRFSGASNACRLRDAGARGGPLVEATRGRGICRAAVRAALGAGHGFLSRRHGAQRYRRPASGQAARAAC